MVSTETVEDAQSTTSFTSAKKLVPYTSVQCETIGGHPCDQQVDAVTVTGSQDVFIRYEPTSSPDTFFKYKVVKGDFDDQRKVAIGLQVVNGLVTLRVEVFKKQLEVVLLQQGRLQHVVNQGSGALTIESNILATQSEKLHIAAMGSGDIFVDSTDLIAVDSLTLFSDGSGRIQTTFSEVQVSTMSVKYSSSGDIAIFSEVVGIIGNLSVAGGGSGSACLNFGSSFSISQFSVQQTGSGVISVGPMGSCQKANLFVANSGDIDVGGVQCDNVEVDVMGSGDVVCQALENLSGEVYGDGNLEYSGATPQSIRSGGFKQLHAKPVAPPYVPKPCEKHKRPVLKLKKIVGVADSAIPRSMQIGSSSDDDVVTADSADTPLIIWRQISYTQDSAIPLVVVVFIVALVLRWFNESRRRAREEERLPLLGAQRRIYI